jgi:hypothetical protein
MLVQCEGCRRHVRDDEAECPFCAVRRGRGRRRALKVALAGAAGVTAMTIGIGCAYGMPEESADAAPDADSGLEDASDDASGQ